MNMHDLLQAAFLKPLWQTGLVALGLFLLVWWRERTGRTALPLAAMALGWIACHLVVTAYSYQFPPKPPEDWLVFGAAVVLPGAVTITLTKQKPLWAGLLGFAAYLTVVWLALREMPYLLEREELPADRQRWTAYGLGAAALVFLAAEWAGRRLPACALLSGLAVVALITALALWRMSSPERTVARPLAAAGLGAGAALAALWHRNRATIAPGMAGWMAGGVLVLLVFGCLSRASAVPLEPIAAGAAALPATAVVLWLYSRLFQSGRGPAFLAGCLLAGAAIFHFAAQNAKKVEADAAAPRATGADDSGAYE